MADMKNFDFALAVADVIVDKKRAVQQFPYMGPFPNQPTHARETSQQLDVLDQRTAEVRGSLRVVLSNVPDDFREIV